MRPSCYSPPLYAIRCYAMKWKALQCNVCNGIMYIYIHIICDLFIHVFIYNYIDTCCMHACMQNWDGYNTNLNFGKSGYTNNKMDYDIFPKWQNHPFFDESKNNNHRRIPELVEENTQESQMTLIVNRKQHYSDPTISLNPWKSHEAVGFIELDDGNFLTGNPYIW